jgi:NADP-reducing hydrogenase subunit HndD
MACPGGCIGGGGQPYNVTDKLRALRTKGLFDCDGGMKLRFSHENPAINKLYDEFLGEPLSEKAHSLLHAHYVPRAAYKR